MRGDMLNGLDLCSGIGGLAQSLEPLVRAVAYCERDRSCQRILLSRMHRGEIDRAPIWDDLATLRGRMLPPIDLITAGFPCQDLSLAGNRKGLGGERSGIFWHVVRLAEETKAPLVFLENVAGVRKFIPTIRDAFENLGYSVRDGFLAAGDVGARHRRERWFAMAYSDRFARSMAKTAGRFEAAESPGALASRETADALCSRVSKCAGGREAGDGRAKSFGLDLLEGNDWDEYAAFLLRVDHGLPHRGDRLRAMGNGVVPQQAQEAFERLSGMTMTFGMEA